jgi:Flp pilus assembly protein TadD, contains TPR repeats
MTTCADAGRRFGAALLAPALLALLLGGCATTSSTSSNIGGQERTEAARQNQQSQKEKTEDQARSEYQSALKLMQQGNDDAAIKALRKLSSAAPQWSGPPTNLGLVLARNQHWGQAARAFAQAVQANPQNAVAATWLGIAQRHQGNYPAAEQAYQQALKINPRNADAHLDLGILYDVYLHQPTDAIAQYQAYLADGGKNDLIVRAWIRALQPQPAPAGSSPAAAATAPSAPACGEDAMRKLLFALMIAALLPSTSFAAKAGTSKAGNAAKDAKNSPGTTIIGGQESPIGLYITPWKNDYAQPGLGRPESLLQERPAPIDPDVFDRQVEYHDAISAYRAAQLSSAGKAKH